MEDEDEQVDNDNDNVPEEDKNLLNFLVRVVNPAVQDELDSEAGNAGPGWSCHIELRRTTYKKRNQQITLNNWHLPQQLESVRNPKHWRQVESVICGAGSSS